MLNSVQFCEAARPDTSLELAQKNNLFKNQTSLHMMMASDIIDIIVEQHVKSDVSIKYLNSQPCDTMA